MSHHNFEMRFLFKDMLATPADKQDQLGATGAYPNGSIAPRDEGEIQLAVAADPARRVVLVDFGQLVHRLGMTPEEAESLADLLREKARAAR